MLRDELKPLGVRNQVVLAYRESATYSTRRDRSVDLGGGFGYDSHGDFTTEELDELLTQVEADSASFRSRSVSPRGITSAACAVASSLLRNGPASRAQPALEIVHSGLVAGREPTALVNPGFEIALHRLADRLVFRCDLGAHCPRGLGVGAPGKEE